MKKVLVTGTSRGLGRALVEELSIKNYEVVATARTLNSIQGLKSDRKIELDISKHESVLQAVELLEDLDIVINNAGVSFSGSIENTPIDKINNLFNINFLGTIRMMQQFTPILKRKGGLIINISSGTALGTPPLQGVYAASKAALDRVTEAYRMEVKQFGIKVMTIHSTGIDTEMRMNQQMFINDSYQKLASRIKHIESKMKGVNPNILARTIVKIIEEQPDVDLVNTFELTKLINEIKKEGMV